MKNLIKNLTQKVRAFPRYVLSSTHLTTIAILTMVVLFFVICNHLPVLGAMLTLAFFAVLIYILLYCLVGMIREM